MGKPIVYEFAEIDSHEEIIVHLGHLDFEEPPTVMWLADLLRMPRRQLVECFALPHNVWVASRVYMRLRRATGRIDAGLVGNEDAIELPEVSVLDDDEVCQYLFLILNAYGDGDTYRWELPRRDLYLPLSPDLLLQLSLLYQEGPSPKKIIHVGRVDDAAGHLDTFEHCVTRLEKAIDAKFDGLGEGGSYAEVFAGIQMAQSVVDLQRRHWWSEERKEHVTSQERDVHEERLAPLDAELTALGEHVFEEFSREYVDKEHEYADALLDLLDPKEGPASLHHAIKLACTDRQALSPKLLNKVFELTERALSALARSDRAERFVREHVIDILEEMGRDLSPAAKEALKTTGKLGADTIDEWNEAIEMARIGVGTHEPGTSPLRWVGHAVRTYRTGLSSLNALLEHGVVAQVFVALRKARGGLPAIVPTASRDFAKMLLRSLANTAVQHRHKIAEPFLEGAPQLGRILRTLDAIDVEMTEARVSGTPIDSEFWTRTGQQLRDLQVRTMPRSVGGASLRMSVSLIAVFLSADRDERTRWIYWTTLASAATSLGEHGMRTWEFFHKFPEDAAARETTLYNFDRAVRMLSGLASVLSGITATGRAFSAARRGRKGAAALEAVSGLSNFAAGGAQFMMLSKDAMWLRFGAVMNVWAVGVGIVAFVGMIIYEQFVDVGSRPVLEAVLDRLGDLPKLETARLRMKSIAGRVQEADPSLSTFREIAGSRDDEPTGGSPTLWKAAKLGFSKPAIAKMFGSGDVYVSTVLSPYFDRAGQE